MQGKLASRRADRNLRHANRDLPRLAYVSDVTFPGCPYRFPLITQQRHRHSTLMARRSFACPDQQIMTDIARRTMARQAGNGAG
jgi:hypothetical protein